MAKTSTYEVFLDRDEFARALKQGRGAAYLHVQRHGLEGREDLLLKACLENLAFDGQCEESRGYWLYEMIKAADARAWFAERILAAIADPREDYSLRQLCSLCCGLAEDGNEDAARALKCFVLSQDFDGEACESGTEDLVRLFGLPALRSLARRYGRLLQEDPEAWAGTIRYFYEDASDAAAALAELDEKWGDDAALATWVAAQRKELAERNAREQETAEQAAVRRLQNEQEFRAAHSLQHIFVLAADKIRPRFKFKRFGQLSDAAALQAVIERIESEPDPQVCARLLWVFHDVAMPSIPQRVWQLVEDPDTRVQAAALTALSNLTDVTVGGFARRWLRARRSLAEGPEVIKLLTNNFEPGDEILLARALEAEFDDDTLHAIGFALLDFIEKNSSPAVSGLMEWLYRTNPCTICRERVVALMQAAGTLPGWIGREARHDASSETRKMFT